MLRTLILVGVSAMLPSLQARGEVLARGTNLEVRLLTRVGSRFTKPGDPVQAVVIAPVMTNRGLLPLQGATLSGTVARVNAVGLGLIRGAAELDIRFTRIRLRDGSEFPVEARIREVETARERVDGSGTVTGIDPAASLSSGFSFLMSTVLIRSELEAPALLIKVLAARSPDSEILLPAGAELFVRLVSDMKLDDSHVQGTLPESVTFTDLMNVRTALDKLPSQQTELGGRRSSDLVNIVLLGSKQEVDNAFHTARWTGEAKHGAMALYGMFHCLIERRGFRMAPMSRLRLNGMLPSSTYQKSLDSMAKRHHVRFWGWGDSQIWFGAATEDVALAVHHMHLTHATEQRIDSERAKVINDLWFAGCVRQASLLRRDNFRSVARDDSSISTDGELAVLRLGRCDADGNSIADSRITVRDRLTRILYAAAIDMVRANPATVGATAVRTVVGAIRRGRSPSEGNWPSITERASIGDTPSDQMAHREEGTPRYSLLPKVKLTVMSVSTGTGTPLSKVGR